MQELAIMMAIEAKRRQENINKGKQNVKPLVSPKIQKLFNDL